MARSQLRTILSLGCSGVSSEQRVAFTTSVESQGGWLFGVEIEGIWASFPDPFGALCATAEILEAYPETRAGLHVGDVTLTEDGDLLGHALSVAKRLESEAPLGTAHLSLALSERVSQPKFFAEFSEPYEVTLKGIGVKLAVRMEPVIRRKERAFKFLDAYTPGDKDVFFGRATEVDQLFELLENKGWVTLFGPSGVGKSSLLGGGLFPRYQKMGFVHQTIRCFEDPLNLLRESLGSRTDQPLEQALLKRIEELGCQGLIFCFDQFEEFFLRLSRNERMNFWDRLRGLLDNPALSQVRWIFSLREDFLAEMSEAEEVMEGFLNSRFQLTALTREQARDCILGPAQRSGRWTEPELVEQILEDLYLDGIDPPELQIVLDRLDVTRPPGSHWLTLDAYRSFGGFQEILVDYLYEVLDRVSDREVARQILLSMVTEQDTKKATKPSEIARALNLASSFTVEVLEELKEARLVRQLFGEGLVELSHEYLLEEIHTWADEEELAARYAASALETELETWLRLGSLMDGGRLRFLNSQRERLKPTLEERELLVRASVTHGISPRLWLDGSGDTDVLLRLLDDIPDGIVQRRLIAELYSEDLPDLALEKLYLAAEAWGNPTLLDALQGSSQRRKRGVERGVARRFFGPHKMVKIVGGPFLFGSSAENKFERKRALHRYLHPKIDSEAPLQELSLDDYWLDICPVTNAEYAEFLPSHLNRFPPEEGDHPVVSITLAEAESYALWLGKELPSEQEWEKGARGVEGQLYPWGNRYNLDFLNSGNDEFKQTTSVSSFLQGVSPNGCLDMAGNVWEWTRSKWNESGPFIVQKGGSTVCEWPQLQCSARMDAFPDFVLRWTGFRLKSNSPRALGEPI